MISVIAVVITRPSMHMQVYEAFSLFLVCVTVFISLFCYKTLTLASYCFNSILCRSKYGSSSKKICLNLSLVSWFVSSVEFLGNFITEDKKDMSAILLKIPKVFYNSLHKYVYIGIPSRKPSDSCSTWLLLVCAHID